MTNQIDVWAIINYLNTITDITNITWNRISFWPPDEEQTGIYITLNVISENNQEINKKTRIEFRCIWHNTTIRYDELMDLRSKIVYNLLWNKYTSNQVYWVIEDDNLINSIDSKNRKVVLFDLLFYLIN